MINLRHYFTTPLVRYIFVGGLSYVIEIGFLALLIKMGTGKITAVAISFWVGLIVSFLLQKLITFQNTDKGIKQVTAQTLFYGLLVAINYGFTILFVAAFNRQLGVFVARTLALVITTAWNYFIYKKIIFRKSI